MKRITKAMALASINQADGLLSAFLQFDNEHRGAIYEVRSRLADGNIGNCYTQDGKPWADTVCSAQQYVERAINKQHQALDRLSEGQREGARILALMSQGAAKDGLRLLLRGFAYQDDPYILEHPGGEGETEELLGKLWLLIHNDPEKDIVLTHCEDFLNRMTVQGLRSFQRQLWRATFAVDQSGRGRIALICLSFLTDLRCALWMRDKDAWARKSLLDTMGALS
jgi:hypothetical protein